MDRMEPERRTHRSGSSEKVERNVLKIPKTIYERMIAHAQREAPLECCGILAGRDGRVERAFEMRNQEQSPTRYSLSPLDQLKVFDEMEKDGLEMVAIYHSHTHTDPYPSKTDIELAFYPEVTTVIVSLKEDPPLVRAYKIKEETVHPEEIEIV
ncbi:MAG: M67 family metallopeptidase [Desulfobacterota bacterium]|nr:M67 family metallopeptidase [Thermodesulfobacteriota bacterium]